MPPCALLCPFVPFLSRRGPQVGAPSWAIRAGIRAGLGARSVGQIAALQSARIPAPSMGSDWGRALAADPERKAPHMAGLEW